MQHVTLGYLPLAARSPARKDGCAMTASYSVNTSMYLLSSVVACTKANIIGRGRVFCHPTVSKNAPAMAR